MCRGRYERSRTREEEEEEEGAGQNLVRLKKFHGTDLNIA